jgi:septal ring factor EnvC (AmiA/AmiB activator)
LQATLQAEKDMVRDLQGQLSEVQGDLDEAQIDKAQAEAEVEKCRNEIKDLESAVVRAQTDLIVVRAELDGAYGTRAQRAADVTMNPAVQKEMDELNDKNTSLQNEIKYLKTQDSGGDELKKKVTMLQKELKETIEDYEQMTKASIEFEKDREQLEASVDAMREKCEGLEGQLSEEKVKWLGMKSPGVHGPSSPSTSTMVLKNEFKKMMRDTRAENLKALRVRLPLCMKMTLLTRVNRPSKTKGESLRHLCALSRLNSY